MAWTAITVALSCSQGCTPRGWTTREQVIIASLTSLPPPAPRPSNRYADDPAAAALGRRLFEDAGFSVNGQVSCATCHDPARHFTDGQPVPNTLGKGRRNVPSVETVAWQTWFFWDGRADSGWSQATGPLTNPIEMGATPASVAAHVRRTYAAEWATVFGEDVVEAGADDLRVLAQVGKAIEAFERTLSPGEARFDRWAAELAAGRESDLLNDVEQRGLRLFIGDAACVSCHGGPLFTDHSFHTLGLPQVPQGGMDIGRVLGATQVLHDPLNCAGAYSDTETCPELRYLDPSFPDWAGAFKTPGLRNVTATAPYTHDGAIPTLDAMLMFYDQLPGRPLIGHRELTLAPLRLSDGDREAIIAFLGTLDGV